MTNPITDAVVQFLDAIGAQLKQRNGDPPQQEAPHTEQLSALLTNYVRNRLPAGTTRADVQDWLRQVSLPSQLSDFLYWAMNHVDWNRV